MTTETPIYIYIYIAYILYIYCGNVSKMLQETYLHSYLRNYVQVHLEQKLL